MTQETIEKVRYAESLAYVHFVCLNSKHLKEIHKSPEFFSNYDCSGTTLQGQKFIIEFKIRNLLAKDWSGSTMIENSKLKALQAIWKQNKGYVVKYICYFNDCMISFNLSKRYIQGGNSDILSVFDHPCMRSTLNSEQNYIKDKRVNHLCFADIWNDKIIQYE